MELTEHQTPKIIKIKKNDNKCTKHIQNIKKYYEYNKYSDSVSWFLGAPESISICPFVAY